MEKVGERFWEWFRVGGIVSIPRRLEKFAVAVLAIDGAIAADPVICGFAAGDNAVYFVARGFRLSSRLSSLLLIHDNSELLDTLTRFLEARGFEVSIAATAFAAIERLQSACRPGSDFQGDPESVVAESVVAGEAAVGAGPDAGDDAASQPGSEPDVVIAGWDSKRTTGAEVYQWALRHRYHLRDRFVFVAGDPPERFDELVRGRCLLVDVRDRDEIGRVVESLVLRVRMSGGRDVGCRMASSFDPARPSLLLVEDEPLQLTVMRMALSRVGFSVTSVDSGNAAVEELQRADYDVILSDWFMDHGSGSDLYRWLAQNRPDLKRRCIFVSANPLDGAKQVRDCPFLPKGQDSPALFRRLKSIAGDLRAY